MSCLRLSRRDLLVAGMGLLASPAAALDRGARGGRDLVAAMGGLERVGATDPLAILISPGCHRGDDLLALADRTVGRDAIGWIPFGWHPSDDEAVSRLLDTGVAGLEVFVGPVAPGGNSRRGARQRQFFDGEVYMPLAAATGRPPAAPTQVLAVGPSEMRVWRGAATSTLWEDILTLRSKVRDFS